MAKYKYYSWMAAFIMGLGIISYQPVRERITEKPVDKKFTLAIYKSNDYLSGAYNSAYAQVHVTVEKMSGSNSIVELDTTFDSRLLKNYPAFNNAQVQEVTIPNVFANREAIKVNYVLTYYTAGSQLQMQNSMILNNENEHLDIGI